MENALLSKLNIEQFLNVNLQKVLVLKETESTNNLAKELALQGINSAIVVSESQTKGRGRLNREFYSPKNKGIYLSVLLRPNIELKNASKITAFCGICVAKAIESLASVKVGIKWVNDLFINGKKVGGILTESAINGETRSLDYVVIGIGVNVFDDEYPDFIKDIATNIEKESGAIVNKNELIAKIVNNLFDVENAVSNNSFLKEYKQRQIILNKQIKVVSLNDEFYGVAIDIDENGNLIVNNNGTVQTISAGDVSIKI